MSEAKAQLVLDASRATQGAKQFEQAAEMVFNADKKTKDQLERPVKGGLNGSQGGLSWDSAKSKRVKDDLSGIAGEFGKISVNGKSLDGLFSRIGSAGAGLTAIAAAALGVAKGFYDAKQRSTEFEESLRKIRRTQTGSVEGKSLGDLESELGDIRERRRQEFDPNKRDSNFGIFRDALMAWDAFSNQAGVVRSERLREVEKEALDRLGKKQQEITDIVAERLQGSEEEAEVMRLQAEYAERIAKARNGGNGSPEQVQALTQERELAISQARTRFAASRIEQNRSSREFLIRLGGGDALDIAQNSLNAAREAASLPVGSEEENRGRQQAINQAHLAVELAKKEKAERAEILASQRKLSEMRGSDSERQRASLEAEVSLNEALLRLANGRREQEERKLNLAKARQALDDFDRNRQLQAIQFDVEGSSGRIQNLAAARGLGTNSESAQRLSLQANIQAAQQRRTGAEQALEMLPNDPQAIAAVEKARADEERARIELKQFNRDIGRTKEDSIKMSEAENSAILSQLRGLTVKAELTRAAAQNEAEIIQAQRAGNTELAKSLQIRGQLIQSQIILQAVTGEDGRVKTAGQVSRETRAERRLAARNERAFSRMKNNGFLTDVQRDLSGNIVSGRDILTGERRAPSEDWQNREMAYRQNGARQQRRAESVQAKLNEQKSERINSGGATPDEALADIARIIRKWDS